MRKISKKGLIRSSIVAIAVVFAGMVVMSAMYVRKTTEVLRNRYDTEVNRALIATVKAIEERDVVYQIEQIAKDNTTLSAFASTVLNDVDTATDVTTALYGRSTTRSTGFYGITAAQMEKEERNLEMARELVMEVMVRKNAASNTPILERIDTAFLRETMCTELEKSGINGEFSLALVRHGKLPEIFFLNKEFPLDGENVYNRMLFHREVTNRSYDLVVYLKDKSAYVYRYMRLVLPILICMTILAILVILTIFFLIQNQRLSEIQNAFIKNMTHELKTPVASISLAAEMMSDSSLKMPIESYVSKARIIKSETSRLTQIVERVLQSSVLGQQGVTYKVEKIDVHRVIEQSRDSFMLKVQQCQGKIIVRMEAAKHVIYADKMHLTNVVFNLMENAVKYSDKSRPLIIDITTRNEGNMLVIEVTDNGIGIEAKYLRHIFDRFYRVPSQGEHHDVKGFGLGLSYVKEVVKKNGGNIEVQSEPGVGTRFSIEFEGFES